MKLKRENEDKRWERSVVLSKRQRNREKRQMKGKMKMRQNVEWDRDRHKHVNKKRSRRNGDEDGNRSQCYKRKTVLRLLVDGLCNLL